MWEATEDVFNCFLHHDKQLITDAYKQSEHRKDDGETVSPKLGEQDSQEETTLFLFSFSIMNFVPTPQLLKNNDYRFKLMLFQEQ